VYVCYVCVCVYVCVCMCVMCVESDYICILTQFDSTNFSC